MLSHLPQSASTETGRSECECECACARVEEGGGVDPAHTRDTLSLKSNAPTLSAVIGCSTDAAISDWMRGVPFNPNSISVVNRYDVKCI